MNGKTRKLLGLALSIVMVLGLLPAGPFAPMEALASGTVSYLYPVYRTVESETKADNGIDHWENNASCTGYLRVTGSGSAVTWGKNGQTTWYVAGEKESIYIAGVTVNGDVHLILMDGCDLKVNGGDNAAGICVTGENSLTIYGQSSGSGKLEAIGGKNAAAIGGGKNEEGKNITINGGVVIATATGDCGYKSSNGAGIGGGGGNGQNGASGSNITINGGIVIATAGVQEDSCNFSSGIGGGGTSFGGPNSVGGSGFDITINGGIVTAYGGEDGGAGIGGGSCGSPYGGTGGTGSGITINGGTVTANGGAEGGAGIGGSCSGNGENITITGGIVTANGGGDGAGIGGGSDGTGSNVFINGGGIAATGGTGFGVGAGIGNGYCMVGVKDANDIKAAEGVEVRAGSEANPTTKIASDEQGDYAANLAGKQYVSAGIPNYLTFTAQESDSSVTFNYSSGTNVQYKKNNGTWDNCSSGTKVDLKKGDTVSFRGINVITKKDAHFAMTGKIAASGDVTSLTNGYGGDAILTERCYSGMFLRCTSLTSAPSLPSTTLAKKCYNDMFKGCKGLAKVQ